MKGESFGSFAIFFFLLCSIAVCAVGRLGYFLRLTFPKQEPFGAYQNFWFPIPFFGEEHEDITYTVRDAFWELLVACKKDSFLFWEGEIFWDFYVVLFPFCFWVPQISFCLAKIIGMLLVADQQQGKPGPEIQCT